MCTGDGAAVGAPQQILATSAGPAAAEAPHPLQEQQLSASERTWAERLQVKRAAAWCLSRSG